MLHYNLSRQYKIKMSRRKQIFRIIRLSSFLFFFCSMIVLAENTNTLPNAVSQQQIIITGTVTDTNGEPLPGASVMIKGATQGTTTDFNGAFSLPVSNENATLVFSFVGFMTQEVTVGSRRVINITMNEVTQQMEEIVVIGYGTVRKSDLTGSVSSVKAAELAAVPKFNDAITDQNPGY